MSDFDLTPPPFVVKLPDGRKVQVFGADPFGPTLAEVRAAIEAADPVPEPDVFVDEQPDAVEAALAALDAEDAKAKDPVQTVDLSQDSAKLNAVFADPSDQTRKSGPERDEHGRFLPSE